MTKSKIILFILLLFVAAGCKKDPPPQLELSLKEVIISNLGGTEKIVVQSNGKWSATISASWCTISPTSGSGDGEITITANNNFTNEDRGVTLYVTSKGLKKSARLTQNYSRLDTDKSELSFGKEKSDKTVYITSNTKWSIEVPQGVNWISASPASGENSMDVKIAVEANQGMARGESITIKYGNTSKQLSIAQERSTNSAPTKPSLVSPADNITNANRLPILRWKSSSDPDNDIVIYTVEYSKNSSVFSNSIQLSDSVYYPPAFLEENQKYYWRVKARDNFGGETISEVRSFTTGTKKSYLDGEYRVAFENTKGAKPSELLFIGDGYLPEDHEEGALFDKDINDGIEHFFSVEPYKSYRDYFKVYKLAGYSRESGVTQTDKSITKNTKYKVMFKGGSSMESASDIVFSMAKTIPGVDDYKLRDMLIVLVVNQNRYAGTCWTWTDGRSIAIAPVSKSVSAGTNFRNLIMHEAGGHGFGRLADEYISSSNAGKTITDEEKQKLRDRETRGHSANVSLTGDSTQVKWKHFILKPGYSRVGTFQGAYYFPLGVWKPEISSCMVFNEPYYNAPSREAIVKRIFTTAGVEYTLEAFVAKDIEKAPSQSVMVQTKSMNPLTFIPLAPPVYVK